MDESLSTRSAARVSAAYRRRSGRQLARSDGCAVVAAPVVVAVLNGFGEVWRAESDDALGEYARLHADCLAPLLLFELAHEGRPTPRMKRAAHFGGIELPFERWARRLRARSD